jgi:pimeloyl-ACP methyl ester carboxylesterase
VSAVPGNLPEAVAAVLCASAMEEVPSGESLTVAAAGMTWAARAWGSPKDDPVLLVHGIMSDAGVFWRLAPALAAAGHRVFAIDMPAHGETGPWRGRYAIADTAADLAALIRSLDLDADTLSVLGPLVGRDGRRRPLDRRHPTTQRALTRFDAEAVRSILSRNGGWDSGLTLLAEPAASGVPIWYLRGEPQFGGLIPDYVLPQLAARVGDSHVLTISDGSHAPMRTRHPEATTLAILHALAG